MPYNPNIPQPTDKLQDSQPEILANFQNIDTIIAVNHYTFGTANEGKHKLLQLPVQGSAPAIPAGEVAIYNINNAVTTFNEMYIKRRDGTSTPITAANTSASGFYYLPSGHLVKYGTAVSLAGDNFITYPVGGAPVFATVLNAQVTAIATLVEDKSVTLVSFTTTQIQICGRKLTAPNTGAGCTFYYVVIGT